MQILKRIKVASTILQRKMERGNHNTTMARNEISFLRLCRGWTILTSFSLKFTFHPYNKGLGSLRNVNCEEGSGSGPAMSMLPRWWGGHMYRPWQTQHYGCVFVGTLALLNYAWGANECFKKLTRFSELSFVLPLTEKNKLLPPEKQRHCKLWFTHSFIWLY